jgi:hypothetical protein
MGTPRLVAIMLLAIATSGTTSSARPPTALQANFADRAESSNPRDADRGPTPHAHGPRLLGSRVADIIVRVRGGAVCTGTPIAGSTLVVTAAHCVLDADGRVSDTRTVVRDGVEHTATSVFVNLDYHHTPTPRLDVAVLVMDEIIPGPSAILSDELPTHGPLTLAGFQPIDTDGSLLRGTRVDDHPLPNGATGPIVRIASAAAGCVLDRTELTVAATHMTAPCGLIPGSSGGGLFVERGNDVVLIGVISTVAESLTWNGLAPTISIHELLADPDTYRHEMHRSTARAAHVNRS